MQVGQHGRVGVVILEPPDLADEAGLQGTCDILSQILGYTDVQALALTLPDGADQPDCAHILTPLCEMVACADRPVVAALPDRLQGASLALALAAQYRLGTVRTVLRSPQGQMGRLPRGGALSRLTLHLGPKVTWEIVVEGRALDAKALDVLNVCDGIARGDVGLAALTLCRKLLTYKAGMRAAKSVPDGICPTGQSDLALAAKRAIDSSLGSSLPEAAALADVLDDQLAEGRQAALINQVLRAEEAVQIATTMPPNVTLSGSACRLAKALPTTSQDGAEVTLHLDPDRGFGVLVDQRAGRVPVAVSGPGAQITCVEIGEGPASTRAMAQAMAAGIGAMAIMGATKIVETLRNAALEAAERCLLYGAQPEEIDAAMRAAGWAQGPFRLGDWAGHRRRVTQRAAEAGHRDPRLIHVPFAEALCAAGFFGGPEPGWSDMPAQAQAALLDEVCVSTGRLKAPLEPEEIVARITTSVGLAAFACLGTASEESVTLAALNGLGLPRHWGGPIWGSDLSELEARRAEFALQEPHFWTQPRALIDRL